MNWLVKEEPTNYSFDDLVRDGRTTWSGVRNALAQKHLRAMQKGDRVLYYHTGNEKAVVGTASVARAPAPDPADPSGKLYAVVIEAGRRLDRPVSLADIKAQPFFADFALVRMARLSVMPVTDAQWERITRQA
jgi:predicted RNA-binding protein with PUA-like domain